MHPLHRLALAPGRGFSPFALRRHVWHLWLLQFWGRPEQEGRAATTVHWPAAIGVPRVSYVASSTSGLDLDLPVCQS